MATAGPDGSPAGTRRLILEAAYALFYRHGFARVGLDQIAERAGVTKRTFYYHFRSKDDLLAEVMEYRSEFALESIRKWAERLPADVRGAIDAIFAALVEWAGEPRFEGAGYTRLAMELADLPGHPARTVARRHKALVEAWLAGALAERGATSPDEAARALQILIEGATALMLIHGNADYARAAADAAKRLVAARDERAG